MTYTVNLSDFVLAYNGIRAYSNGMYTAGGGELESNRIGSTAGANSKTITGYEMPRHAHWFGHYRSDNANDRDVFGPDGGQNHSTMVQLLLDKEVTGELVIQVMVNQRIGDQRQSLYSRWCMPLDHGKL